MTKRVVVIAAAIMSTLLALVALWQFRVVVICVLISLVLAATFRPASRNEARKRFGTQMRLTLNYVMGILVAILLIYLVGRLLIGDFEQLTEALAAQSTWVLPPVLQGSFFERTILPSIPTPDKLFNAITSQREIVLPAVLGITQSLGWIVSGFLIILFLSVYWSVNQNHFERLWLSLIPAKQRKNARYIWRTVERDLGAYTRSELIQSLLAGFLLGVGYYLLGSPYPALLAVAGAVAWLIPLVGGVLAIILPFLLGLMTSAQLSLLTVLYTLVVLAALQIWIEPRLFKLKLDNPILTFVILLAMAEEFGLLGIVAAPPISVIFQILWNLHISDRLPPETTMQVSDLRQQQAHLQATIAGMEGTPPPLVTSSMERLTGLIEKAEPLLKQALPPEPPKMFEPLENGSNKE
jgi:predicted PurR-regulated permease PerM